MRTNPKDGFYRKFQILYMPDLDKRARDFIEYARNANKAYRTNQVAITTGMDFHYQVRNGKLFSGKFTESLHKTSFYSSMYTAHLNEKNLSTNSTRGFEHVLDTMNYY